MGYIAKQISPIVIDSAKQALGTKGVTEVITTDLTSLGKQLAQYDALDGWFGEMAKRITRTVIWIRSYKGRERNVMREEIDFGAFIQKVYYKMPESVDDPAWAIPDGLGQFHQASPYDVEGTLEIKAVTYTARGVWSYEFIRPVRQIMEAFTGASEMDAFINGLSVAVENKYKFDEERLVADAVNTSMATSIVGGKKRNLLAEYNALTGVTALTVDEALRSPDFYKYANKEIARTLDNITSMSTLYNVNGWETFTPEENLVVEMLSEYAKGSETYLEADTYHNDLVSLSGYSTVPFWQSSGTSINVNFADASKINVKHADLNNGDAVVQDGIICFVRDYENVASCFTGRRMWELYNQRSDVMIHGEHAEKGFGIDKNANAIVFYIAETEVADEVV